MKCKVIASAIELLEENNWIIKEEVSGWSEVELVIYFEQKLTDRMRANLHKLGSLDYHRIDQDPHYAREDIFTCKECKVAIAFPLD